MVLDFGFCASCFSFAALIKSSGQPFAWQDGICVLPSVLKTISFLGGYDEKAFYVSHFAESKARNVEEAVARSEKSIKERINANQHVRRWEVVYATMFCIIGHPKH